MAFSIISPQQKYLRFNEVISSRGNDSAKKSFIIKIQSGRIVSLSNAIAGTVSSENIKLNACMIYLYDDEETKAPLAATTAVVGS